MISTPSGSNAIRLLRGEVEPTIDTRISITDNPTQRSTAKARDIPGRRSGAWTWARLLRRRTRCTNQCAFFGPIPRLAYAPKSVAGKAAARSKED